MGWGTVTRAPHLQRRQKELEVSKQSLEKWVKHPLEQGEASTSSLCPQFKKGTREQEISGEERISGLQGDTLGLHSSFLQVFLKEEKKEGLLPPRAGARLLDA